MDALNAALLVNLLGFTVGIALFAMLAAMVVRHRRASTASGVDVLLLVTAALGLVWNAGELVVTVQRDFNSALTLSFMTAAAYSALGFLPSVVVHSAQNEAGRTRLPAWIAYGLSFLAGLLHFHAAATDAPIPSALALQMLTLGAITLAGVMLVLNFRQKIERKAIWATALLVFAVSALHLSRTSTESSWWVELIAHQSSIPLALVILYQNFRFAFADLFLKRAISLVLIAAVALGLYVGVAAPILRYHETHDRNDVFAISVILTLWIATALVYPLLHRAAEWLVDRVILRRAGYADLQEQVEGEIRSLESVEDVLEAVTLRVAEAMTARSHRWVEIEDGARYASNPAEFLVPTAESPAYRVTLGDLAGGRRLLSDEANLLSAIGLVAARRIDSIRVMHERCEREFREQEYSKLATEAELKALRSQINPHFLFNALTTVGYLIESSPKKAVATLMHLTKLLRAVLRSTGEFSTLGDEIRLIEDYLDIERARFEERLIVQIDVPAELSSVQIPAFVLQPLAENAIKHGISANKAGGELWIHAERADGFLKLSVRNTAAGRKLHDVSTSNGVGLQNIRDRLKSYFGPRSTVTLDLGADGWTTAEVRIPLDKEARIAA
jgi:two-component system LytT family sensor kinase